jgi:hypothetical protein
MIQKKLLCICLLCFLVITGSSLRSAAETYTLVPSVKVWGGYDDNIRFSRFDKRGDWAGILTGVLEFSTLAERYNITGRAAADIIRYVDENDFDRENYFLDLRGNYRISSRWSADAFFGFTKDTTLDSFLEDTGTVIDISEVYRYRARAGLNYQLTELTNLDFEYRFRRNDFKDDRRVDTTANIFTLRYNKNLATQRDTFITEASYGFTRSDTTDSDTVTVQLGWNHDFSPRLRFTGLLGPRYTQQRFDNRLRDDSNQWGALSNLLLTYQSGELDTARIGFRNDLRPDSEGDLLIVYRLYADYTRKITERLTGVISGRVSYSQRDDEDVRDELERTFWEIRPVLTYALTQRFDLELGYWFQQQIDDNRDDDKSVERNRVWFAFTCNFQNVMDLWN